MDTAKGLIGRRIAQWRAHRGMEAAALATALGVDEAGLEAIETGEVRPTAAQLTAATDALDATLDDLTDPFRLAPGEARFSWRLSPQEEQEA